MCQKKGVMENLKKEYTFMWLIENYSYTWHKNGEKLISPEFTADGLDGTAWCLQLYPRGLTYACKGYISLFLNRSKADEVPENFPLKYELSLITANGTAIKSTEFDFTFKMGSGYGRPEYLDMGEVLLRKTEYLPQDCLSVRCRIWRGEGKVQPAAHITARTRIGIEHVSFLHVLDGFSTLKPNEKNTIQMRSTLKKECVISSNVYFSDGSCCEERVMVKIIPSNANHVLSKCNISLLDASGKETECGQADNRFDADRKDIEKLILRLTRKEILDRKSKYLPNDKLSLSCECTFATGIECEKIEKTVHKSPFVTLKQIRTVGKDISLCAEKLSECSSALDDLKEVFSNQFLTDVELKTKTKSFPAHKILLCARSPVFKLMMTNDMKEKNNNIIQVDDLEDDTVQQLLLFLYYDNLENLQWDSAIKLYYAADKYAVEKLKKICSAFMVERVNTSSVSELLLLADKHNDDDLKKDVEDFIFKNEKQVYGSDEWENLLETNPKLVSKTMLLIHKRKL